MKFQDINIRDPFILKQDGRYYMYGTRAAGFGIDTKGFDVYVSDDLENWSEPIECLNSESQGYGKGPNWAPEVHFYNGKYYMLATFCQKNGLRGTFCCVADKPEGPFVLNSDKALTPEEWECLDGTLYISKDNVPYLVFCHEHTQIINGTVCYVRLNDSLSAAAETPTIMFKATDPFYIVPSEDKEKHYVTDGPFLIRSSKGELFLIWSTFINGKYAECIAKSDNGEIDGDFVHLNPISSENGGHGMIFEDDGQLKLIMHYPNTCGLERPMVYGIIETDESLEIVK